MRPQGLTSRNTSIARHFTFLVIDFPTADTTQKESNEVKMEKMGVFQQSRSRLSIAEDMNIRSVIQSVHTLDTQPAHHLQIECWVREK